MAGPAIVADCIGLAGRRRGTGDAGADGQAPENLPGAVRRRRTRRGPCRRAQGPRRVSRAGPLHRRYQHGLAGRRRLRLRHDGRGNGPDHGEHHEGTPVQGKTAARGAVDAAQGRRLQALHRPRNRHKRRQCILGQGYRHRRPARDRIAPALPDQGLPELRQAADPFPRRGDRSGERQGRGIQGWRARQRHARQHVGTGRGGAGGVRRHDAGGRHADQQPAGRRGAGHGRRYRHRRERRHPAAEAR